jgi:class 3 adenylate cyclase/formylglycine-generating enzyme required for sulfatase activity
MDLYENNIDQLLQARSEIDEELRRHKAKVTVFFTDIVGSTNYFDRFGDTAGLLLLHRHDSLVTSAVEEFHGIVVKEIGDSVMAEFPEPGLAVRAAVAIQRRLWLQNQSAAENERLQIRTGINYGTGFRRGNDLFGDAINLAARITKRSGPGQILISRALREVLPDSEFVCQSLGGISLDGKAESEELYEVIWTDATLLIPSHQSAAMSFAACSADESHATPDLPRYEILARAGAGSTGVLFKARDRETGEIVALKVLKSEVADPAGLTDAFKNEFRLARKITHKNVCRIYDFNRAGSTSFISMEFVEGESLRRVLGRFNALSTRTALKIANQICDGLHEAHSQGIVHRDLKPENLMIDTSGNVKLMDFGVAQLIAEGSTTNSGTPSYMSPEQAQGDAVDERCDIYALGLVLFEMLTGSRTFTGDTPMAVALKQIEDAPQNPRDIEYTIPEHISQAILRCLEKNPEKRFQSVLELQAALSDNAHSTETASRFRKNAPWAAHTAVGLATLVAVFLTAALIFFARGTTPKPVPGAPPSDADFSAFRMAESINTEEAWNAFLNNHRESALLPVARERVQRLRVQAQTSEEAPVVVAAVPEKKVVVVAPAAATPAKVAPAKGAPAEVVPAEVAPAEIVPLIVAKPPDPAPVPKWPALADTVLIPDGVFMMGKDNGKRDEKPEHQVRVDAFRISRSGITNRQYLLFLNDTGYPRPKDPGFAKNYLMAYPDLPVVNVSYQDAVEFCKWASAKFAATVRLPTEAEWEGARNPATGDKQSLASGSDWEWVSDFYSKDYYKVSPVKNPAGPATGTKRVVRGASQARDSRDPKDHNDHLGFRIVVVPLDTQ